MIIDEASVVTGANFAFNVEQPAGFEGIALDTGAVVESPEQDWDVRLGWSALPCQTAPKVILARAGERIVAKIDRGPEVTPEDSACESMEAHHYVDLALEGVTLDAISVEISGK